MRGYEIKKYFYVILFYLFFLTVNIFAQDIGPQNGSLIIAGGAVSDQAIIERFIDLAGGPDAPIIIIPTAGGHEEYDQFWLGKRQFQQAGATNITILHTKDQKVANTDSFVNTLKNARGVWFSGGRQWRLADAYLNTRVHEELWNLLNRGGVIGGSSAGATIQGSYLARGDTKTNTIMMGDHDQGLAFLKDVAIDQHLLKRNRHFDLIEIIEKYPHLLGIGIDENTAIVVQNDRFEVIGQSYVAIYDSKSKLDSGGKFYFLAPGDRFNLKTREAFRPSSTEKPLDRVIKKEWGQDW
jgi:cyanophycinase